MAAIVFSGPDYNKHHSQRFLQHQQHRSALQIGAAGACVGDRTVLHSPVSEPAGADRHDGREETNGRQCRGDGGSDDKEGNDGADGNVDPPPALGLASLNSQGEGADADGHYVNEGDDSDQTGSDAPPAYDELYGSLPDDGPQADGPFYPTVQLQIEATGVPLLSIPLPAPPEPVAVYVVDDGGNRVDGAQPAFLSLRESRGSGTCSLVTGGGYPLLGSVSANSNAHGGSSSNSTAPPDVLRTLSTTTYRFGPGRQPRVDLLLPRMHGPVAASSSTSSPSPVPVPWDSFEISRAALLSRAQRFRTRLGTFEWRYATRAERRALGAELGGGRGEDVSSLLVLDRVVQVYGSTGPGGAAYASLGGPSEVRRPVARLIRSRALRTAGSTASSAGNGGRLQIDLREWSSLSSSSSATAAAGDRKGSAEAAAAAEEQTERNMVVVLAVTTGICMLKKEVDRRRAQQIAVIAAVI